MQRQLNNAQILTRIDSAMVDIDRILADLESANDAVSASIIRIERRLRSPRYRRRRKEGAL